MRALSLYPVPLHMVHLLPQLFRFTLMFTNIHGDVTILGPDFSQRKKGRRWALRIEKQWHCTGPDFTPQVLCFWSTSCKLEATQVSTKFQRLCVKELALLQLIQVLMARAHWDRSVQRERSDRDVSHRAFPRWDISWRLTRVCSTSWPIDDHHTHTNPKKMIRTLAGFRSLENEHLHSGGQICGALMYAFADILLRGWDQKMALLASCTVLAGDML